jgi:fascin 1/2
LFSIEYQNGGVIALKASNGRYITAKMNGSLYATCDSISDKERFTMTILNRPILIMKCEYGFWGFKAAGNSRIECNKHNYEFMFLEHTWGDEGVYFIKGS